MNRVKSEDDCEMVLEDEMDSPPPAVVSPPSGPPQNKGPWTAAEDSILLEYIKKHGKGNWNAVQRNTGLSRCGKSCRLRWANHLRPNLKKGAFTPEEENLVIQLHHKMGNKWAKMATRLPGRTDNEIKNFWNTRVKRCERADLPVYPASIVGQSSTEDEPVSDDINSGENMARDFLENYLNGNGLILPDFTSDNFISDGLSYGPQLSADSISNLLDQSYASSGWSFTDQVDNFKQSGSVLPALSNTFDGVLPSVDQFSNDSKTLKQTVAPFGVSLPHSHAFLNGTFSASGPINGPLKMELPSLQDVEAYQNNWPKHSEAPAMQPGNNGLLEELLHEAQVVRSGMNQQQTVTCSSSSASTPYYETATVVSPDMCPEYWEDHRTSLLNEYAPFSGSSFTESTPFSAASPDIFQLSNASPAQSASMVSCDQIPELRYESGGSFHPENLMPDALFTENYTTDASVFSDGVPMVLDDDMSSIWSNMLQTYEPLEYE